MTDHTISAIIETQIPTNIRTNYPKFVEFVKTYYEFMESEENSSQTILENTLSLIDIDKTTDAFLTKFSSAYQDTIPVNIAANRRILAKAMTELYKTKGTEASFKLLFRLLFDVNIEISFPKEQIFKSSSNKWIQDLTIFVTVTSGNITDIVGRTIYTKNSSGSVASNILNYKLVSGSTYEIFVSRPAPNTTFLPNDIVSVSGITFSGIVKSTTVDYTVVKSGSGFKAGQIFNIGTQTGSGSKIKVTQVDSDGSIVRAQFINFGIGYQTDFYATVFPYSTTATSSSIFDSTTNGFVENVTIADGSGNVLQSFQYDTTVPEHGSLDPNLSAILYISLGGMTNYPGHYSSIDGFTSDIIKLQDGEFYQDYSYLIKSPVQVNEYRQAVQKLLHPAGMKMFGEYQVAADMDLGVSLDLIRDIVASEFLEEVLATLDSISMQYGWTLSDAISMVDSISFSLSTTFNDNASASDSGYILTMNYALDYFAEDYVGDIAVSF